MLFEKIFKKPPSWLLILVFALTIISAVLSVIIAAGGNMGFVGYIVYAVAGITLAYTVYTFIYFRGKIKSGVAALVNKNSLLQKYTMDYGFRALVGSALSLALNILFGAFNGVMGIISDSYWYGSLSLYYILLAVIYGIIVFGKKDSSYRVYRRSGIILAFLNVVLSIAIAQMIFENRVFEYAGLMIYAFAAFAFYKLTMAIIQLVKVRKQKSPGVSAVAFINLCSGAVSILALQTALLSTFGTVGTDNSLFNTLTGSAVSLTALGISIFMIINGTKKIRMEKNYEQQ